MLVGVGKKLASQFESDPAVGCEQKVSPILFLKGKFGQPPVIRTICLVATIMFCLRE